MSLGPFEIILIIVVIALIFGARKLPELGKGLGQGIKSFKKEVSEPVVPPATQIVTDVPSRPLDSASLSARPVDARLVEPVTEPERR